MEPRRTPKKPVYLGWYLSVLVKVFQLNFDLTDTM